MHATTHHLTADLIYNARREPRILFGNVRGLAVADFVRSLPDCYVRPEKATAHCQATPYAAYRVITWNCEACGGVRKLASRWESGRALLSTDQPPMRKGDDWRHQRESFWFGAPRSSVLLALGMGAGKSRVSINLAANWNCSRVLVLCPKAVVPVWPDELAKHYPGAFSCIADWRESWSGARKAAHLCQQLPLAASRGAVWVALNYEAHRSEALSAAIEQINWDLIICDESHRIASHDSQVSKWAWAMGKRAPRRLCLSGTPMMQNPLSIFGQMRFLDAAVFGTRWLEFRSRYAVVNPDFPSQVWRWINQEEMQERIGWLTWRVDSEDVLDLPETLHQRVPVELPPAAEKAYKSIERDLIASVEGGEITAANALVRLLRLQQIAAGSVPDESGRVVRLHDAKREALEEILQDVGDREKVVVFCQFRADLDAVAAAAKKLGRPHGELSGNRNDLDGNKIPDTPALVLAVQIQSGGAGVDFSRAAYCVYYSTGFSLANYLQSLKRLHRPGQTRPVRYYHLVARGTVDEVVYRSLDAKQEVIESVLSYLKAC